MNALIIRTRWSVMTVAKGFNEADDESDAFPDYLQIKFKGDIRTYYRTHSLYFNRDTAMISYVSSDTLIRDFVKSLHLKPFDAP